ncbi:MAG: FAD-binding oxidoreductase [Gammaproteobacteria bacterium]|nr:FAD-binding oxidoreductase [Gammaproteobacteria bacterium]
MAQVRAAGSSGATEVPAALVSALIARLGAANVLTDPHTLELRSWDFREQRLATAGVVVRPGDTEDVRALVRLANEHAVPVVARGANMSYTLGALPQREGSIIVDMTRMNRILRIDTEDLNIVVEPGVTWAQIHAALAESDYAIPFIGTFSGIRATVGGGLGNWATGWGKGAITDYLLGMEVVLADGRLLPTGALAIHAEHPGMSSYGPDLPRMFVNDAGSFGIKTRACFRLEHKPGGSAYASWGFGDAAAALAFMTEVARLGVATDCFVFGAYHHQLFMNKDKPPPAVARAMLRPIVNDNAGPFNAARNLLTLARTGRMRFLGKWPYSVHVAVDAVNQCAADASMRPLKSIARKHGNTVLPGGFIMAVRALPFGPINDLMIGRDGEICFPSSFTVSLTQGMEVKRALDAFFAGRLHACTRLVRGAYLPCDPQRLRHRTDHLLERPHESAALRDPERHAQGTLRRQRGQSGCAGRGAGAAPRDGVRGFRALSPDRRAGRQVLSVPGGVRRYRLLERDRGHQTQRRPAAADEPGCTRPGLNGSALMYMNRVLGTGWPGFAGIREYATGMGLECPRSRCRHVVGLSAHRACT